MTLMTDSTYNGALLFPGTKLLVVNNKTNKKSFIEIENFNDKNKEEKYLSYYKGLKSKFTIQQYATIPLKRYEVLLSNNKSFICGPNHKSMVYCDHSSVKSPELLPIEFIFENQILKGQKRIYIPWKDIDEKSGSIDISYISIKSISEENNTDMKPVFGIVFAKDSPTVLLMLENGIVIKGDKESDINVNVASKNAS